MKNIRLISRNKTNIVNTLNEWFSSNMLSENENFIKEIENENCKVTVFIAEDYYYRINSTLTLTVIVEAVADKTTVDIIASGGKTGLLGFSYGAEGSVVKRVVKLLEENGFSEID